MSRWTPEDLAQKIADNPALRISGGSSPLGGKVATTPASSSENKRIVGASAENAPHRPRRDYKSELVQQCELIGLKLEPEFRFHPERKFRADWRVHVGMWEGKRAGYSAKGNAGIVP
jgi:hypothetical protein